MDTEIGGDDSSDSVDCSGRKMKPPDKKKFDSSMEHLMSAIKSKETELRNLIASKSVESFPEGLREMKAEKQANIDRRVKIDAELQALNKELQKKNSELTKIQSSLQGYKNEGRIDDAIRKMEEKLKVTNFKLSEEKKIVMEIDNLKRSKKALVSYNQMKREIEGMRDRQRRMREERDRYYKNVTKIKTREDELRRKTQEEKSRSDVLRKAIDDLYDQKRIQVQEYKVQEKEYQQHVKDQRRRYKEHNKRKKREEIQEKEIAYKLAMAEYEASREPYEDERTLCSTLITYLQNALPTDSLDSSGSTAPSVTSAQATARAHSPDLLAQSFEKEGLVLLKKKDEELFSGVVKPRTAKRSKKEKKKTSQKPLHHAPQTLAQFAQLEIKAPPTALEVPETIEKLHSKKTYFESLPAVMSQPPVVAPQLASLSTGSSAPSITESAFTESFPSTPEVCLDSSAPTFTVTRRRLSGDSGAFELDDDSDSSSAVEKSAATESSVVTSPEELCDKDSYERVMSTDSNASVTSNDSSVSSHGTIIESIGASANSDSLEGSTRSDNTQSDSIEKQPQEALLPQLTMTLQQTAVNETVDVESPLAVDSPNEKLAVALLPDLVTVEERGNLCDLPSSVPDNQVSDNMSGEGNNCDTKTTTDNVVTTPLYQTLPGNQLFPVATKPQTAEVGFDCVQVTSSS